jgi:hypothetical protein
MACDTATESLPDGCRILHTNYLNLNGGRAADRIDHATQIIINTSQFDGWRKVDAAVAVSLSYTDIARL